MNCIQCDVCDRWYHEKCANLKYEFDCYLKESYDLIWTCSDVCHKSMLASVLPFYITISKNKIDEFFPFRDNFLCKKCRNNCLTDCIECDACFYWFHFDCANLTSEEIDMYCNSHKDYFCSKRCVMRQLPFNSISSSLNINITEQDLPSMGSMVADNCAERTSNNSDGDSLGSLVVNSETSLMASVALPTCTNFPLNKIISPIDNVNHNKRSKSSQFNHYRQFLDIHCSYLCPNDLEDSFLANESSEFVVYHNIMYAVLKKRYGKENG